MTFVELQTILDNKNIVLRLEGGALRFRAPAGALTEVLRAEISAHRDALIQSLGSNSCKRCLRCQMQDWVDEIPKEGRIRTHCGRCGRFIGYRPENLGNSGKPVLEVSRPAL